MQFIYLLLLLSILKYIKTESNYKKTEGINLSHIYQLESKYKNKSIVYCPKIISLESLYKIYRKNLIKGSVKKIDLDSAFTKINTPDHVLRYSIFEKLHVGMNNRLVGSQSMINSFINATRLSKITTIFDYQSNWSNVSTPIDIPEIIEYDSSKYNYIYELYVYRKISYWNIFDLTNSTREKFHKLDGETHFRPFLSTKMSIQVIKKNIDGRIVYILILPLTPENKEKIPTRYMIYLIPKTLRKDLVKITKSFIESESKNLKQFIDETPYKTISLKIPDLSRKVYNLLTVDCKNVRSTLDVNMFQLIDIISVKEKISRYNRFKNLFRGVRQDIIADKPYSTFIYNVKTSEMEFLLIDKD